LGKIFKCKHCGTELADKEHLARHLKIHKDAAWRDIGYLDPENARYPTFDNPSRGGAAKLVAWLLGKKGIEAQYLNPIGNQRSYRPLAQM